MTMKPAKLNNQGLTLVELLVAVTILGIIVAPLLHTFVSSAYTAKKAREYGDATTAAQNIIEVIEATDTDVLLSNADSIAGGAKFYKRKVDENGVESFEESPEASKDENDKYYIRLQPSSEDSLFDALVTLDASHKVNEKPVTEYTELIATTQASGADNPDNPDNMAMAKFVSAFNSSENPLPSSRFLSRKISVTVGKQIDDNGGAMVRYPINIVYTYTGGFYYGEDNAVYYSFFDEHTSSTDYTANADNADDISADKPVFSMYYFFDTFYGYGNNTDTIYVYNNANNSGPGSHDLCFNLFLVRQKTGATADLDNTYKPSIMQYEPYGLGKTTAESGKELHLPACKVYSNMHFNLFSGEKLTSIITDPTSSSYWYQVRESPGGKLWFTPGTADPELVVSGKLDRLLYINVKLYPRDADFSGKPIASIDATKID